MDELKIRYDGSDKAKQLLIKMADDLLRISGETLTLEIISHAEKHMTARQRASLHIWCEEAANECRKHGTDISLFFEAAKQGFECAFDKMSFKHIVYKPTLMQMRGKESTNSMDTVEPSLICEAISQAWVMKFDYPLPPFPSKESKPPQEQTIAEWLVDYDSAEVL